MTTYLALTPFAVELSGTGKQSLSQPPFLVWQGCFSAMIWLSSEKILMPYRRLLSSTFSMMVALPPVTLFIWIIASSLQSVTKRSSYRIQNYKWGIKCFDNINLLFSKFLRMECTKFDLIYIVYGKIPKYFIISKQITFPKTLNESSFQNFILFHFKSKHMLYFKYESHENPWWKWALLNYIS